MEALKVDGLSINFGGVKAVNDVSFSVEVGERLAIIGPNGAGKTTLFNLINGQLSPTGGQIFFFRRRGVRLANPPAGPTWSGTFLSDYQPSTEPYRT